MPADPPGATIPAPPGRVLRFSAAILFGGLLGGCQPTGPSAAPPNLALGRPGAMVDAIGEASVVTDGQLAPEGSPARNALALPGVGSALLVDLGSVRPVAALLLQAGSADVYFAEVSLDGETWSLACRVAPIPAVPPGLRTHRVVLPRPLPARWLRLRTTTGTSAAVSELQAFESVPGTWPPLDEEATGSALPLWPGLSQWQIGAVHDALASLALLCAGWAWLAPRRAPDQAEDRVRRGLLGVLAALSLLAWPNLGNVHSGEPLHLWEFAHYYLGGKYFPELGYTGLYDCAAAADLADGLDIGGLLLRDLRTDRLSPTGEASERLRACPARFAAARWDAFRQDARFFRRVMGEGYWSGVRRDHGFNAPPVWVLAGGTLANLGPASRRQLELLALLDVGLLLATFVVLGRSFGLEGACLAAAFFGTNALAPFGWTGGALLRYDWLLGLVVGVAALKGGRPGLAGFALAWSTLLRVFPGCALAGALLAMAVNGRRTGAEGRAQLARLAGGAALAALLLVPASCWVAGSPRIWLDFAGNSAKHLQADSANMVGLATFLAYSQDTRLELTTDPLLVDRHAVWAADRAAARRSFRPAVWVAALGYVLLLALASRGLPTWAVAILGLGLPPVVLTLSSYYHVQLLLLAGLWTISPAAGFLLAAFTWASRLTLRLFPEPDVQSAWLSLEVVVLVTVIAVLLARRPVGGGGRGG